MAAIYPQIPTPPLLHPLRPPPLSSPLLPSQLPLLTNLSPCIDWTRKEERGFCPRSITHSIHHLPLQPSLPSQVPTCFWTLKSVNVCLPLSTTLPPVHYPLFSPSRWLTYAHPTSPTLPQSPLSNNVPVPFQKHHQLGILIIYLYLQTLVYTCIKHILKKIFAIQMSSAVSCSG